MSACDSWHQMIDGLFDPNVAWATPAAIPIPFGGSPSSRRRAIVPAIASCLDPVGARPIEVNPDVCRAFRPAA